MHIKQTNIQILRDRIECNYEGFKAETLQILDKEDIFELAGRISAVEDAFSQIMDYEWLTENEIDYLLKFENPLEMIADFLELRRCETEFADSLDDLFDNCENEENYISMELADELREKYGDIPFKEAVTLEIIELGKKLEELKNCYDRGIDID